MKFICFSLLLLFSKSALSVFSFVNMKENINFLNLSKLVKYRALSKQINDKIVKEMLNEENMIIQIENTLVEEDKPNCHDCKKPGFLFNYDYHNFDLNVNHHHINTWYMSLLFVLFYKTHMNILNEQNEEIKHNKLKKIHKYRVATDFTKVFLFIILFVFTKNVQIAV